jgi:hypothetical protein
MLDDIGTRLATEPGEAAGAARGRPAVPRDRDHKSCYEVTAVPRDHDSDDHLSYALAAIEERIELLEGAIAKVGPLALERERLLRARADCSERPLRRRAGRTRRHHA